MATFSKTIFYNNAELLFSFSQVERIDSVKYHVTVVEDKKLLTAFEMRKAANESWKIVQPAPEWVLEVEPTLSTLIQSHMQLETD